MADHLTRASLLARDRRAQIVWSVFVGNNPLALLQVFNEDGTKPYIRPVDHNTDQRLPADFTGEYYVIELCQNPWVSESISPFLSWWISFRPDESVKRQGSVVWIQPMADGAFFAYTIQMDTSLVAGDVI